MLQQQLYRSFLSQPTKCSSSLIISDSCFLSLFQNYNVLFVTELKLYTLLNHSQGIMLTILYSTCSFIIHILIPHVNLQKLVKAQCQENKFHFHFMSLSIKFFFHKQSYISLPQVRFLPYMENLKCRFVHFLPCQYIFLVFWGLQSIPFLMGSKTAGQSSHMCFNWEYKNDHLGHDCKFCGFLNAKENVLSTLCILTVPLLSFSIIKSCGFRHIGQTYWIKQPHK